MRPKKVILCVDDDEEALSVLKFVLETHLYRVLAASNGREAIALFTGQGVDLVLADAQMPRMSGPQLVQNLKAIKAHVPMVLLGKPAKMEMGAADALLDKKTVTASEMLERVKVWSARKRGPRVGWRQQA